MLESSNVKLYLFIYVECLPILSINRCTITLSGGIFGIRTSDKIIEDDHQIDQVIQRKENTAYMQTTFHWYLKCLSGNHRI